MILMTPTGDLDSQTTHDGIRLVQVGERPIWTEVYAWLAMLPLLFITVGGWINIDSGPVAFRITQMDEESPTRRIVRFGCTILMLYLLSTRWREVLSVCKRAKWLVLLPFLAMLSAVWAQNYMHSIVNSANLVVTTLFAVYLYVRYPGTRLLEFLMFGAVLALIASIFLVAFVPAVGMDPYQNNGWRGVFGHKNNCSAVCTLFLVLALHRRPCSFSGSLQRWTVLLLSTVLIVMSGSRTGWVMTLVALLLTGLLHFAAKMRSLDRLAFLMVAVIPTVLVSVFIANNFNEIMAVMDKDPTMTQRTIIWAEVLPSIAKHPLAGYGYQSFWMGLNGESQHAVLVTGWLESQAQDGYLDVLLQLGVLGLFPLIWIFLRGFHQARIAMERRTAGNVVLLATILLLLVLVQNIGESSFLLPLGIPWTYALLSFLILNFANDPVEAV